MSEQDDFLKDIPVNDKPLDEFTPVESLEKEPEKEEEPHKNRQYRRLEAKYQAEREAGIALNERLKVLSEVEKFRQDAGNKPDETIARIWGTNTPEGAEATRLLQQALDAREQRATDKALEQLRKEQQASKEEVSKEIDTLNQIEERIEDEYDVDFSSEQGKALSSAYFSYLERMSPKDTEGNVIAYADPFATWEEFQSKRSPSQQTNRAKDLGSRGMVRSGASSDTKLQATAHENYLKEIGII